MTKPRTAAPVRTPKTEGATAPEASGRFPLSLGQVHSRTTLATGTAVQKSVTASASLLPQGSSLSKPSLNLKTKTLLRPQRHLQQAQADTEQAARVAAPSGLGLDSSAMRQRMVQRLVSEGVHDEKVLQAFARVQRHLFVDTALAGLAYEDTSLPIGLGQTISKPSVVARMLALLMAGGHAQAQGHLGRVLEIGTGCGYQAALLSLLGLGVVSIERLQALHDKACINLQTVRSPALRLLHGDGLQGHAAQAPYHSIIAAAGGEAVPQAWLDQLAVGGRLVAPVHAPGQLQQALMVVDRRPEGLVFNRQEWVNFVPLKSGVA